YGDKLSEDEKNNINSEVEATKKALEGEDLETIKSAIEKLTNASMKLGEKIYQNQQQGGYTGDQAGGGATGSDGGSANSEYKEN
ncbi:MAG: molecular chaperone DnaK, partial [Candidatus Peribacteria bacterium]|nr:molecular chaperone DnaK [Candidatus Peribacteria bacterium]